MPRNRAKTPFESKPRISPSFPLSEHSGAVFADVTSANIVGYLQADSDTVGSIGYGSSFVSLGETGDAINLADITVDSGDANVNGAVTIQTLNNDGSKKDIYYWWYNATHGKTSGAAGWYTAKTGTASTLVTKESGITFVPGQGFWVTGKGYKLVSNGSVLTGKKVVVPTEATGSVMVGNPFPTALNLANITVDSGDANVNGAVTVQTLNNDGSKKDIYYWWYNATHGKTSGTAGWYTAKTGTASTLVTVESNITLPAGVAYWTTGKGYPITIEALNIK